MHPDAEALIAKLGLQPHIEGGFYKETHRSPLALIGLPHSGPRCAVTAVYFMLPAGVFSSFHQVRSDEIWHHYDGDPLELHLLDEWDHSVIVLGRDIGAGQVPQAVVPAGVLQAAIPVGERFSLCGCTVAPGFEFEDFHMPSRADLLTKLPNHADIVTRFTRP